MHPLFGHLQGKEDFKLKSFALAAEWLNIRGKMFKLIRADTYIRVKSISADLGSRIR